MNAIFKRPLLLLVAVASGLFPAARAQTMPQDNWRYDGVNFGSPTAGNGLACIGAGSGGIYLGEVVSGSPSPTKILRFSEAGIFISRFSATFTHLLGITCDSAGNVYVFDRGDSKVKVFSSTGTFLREWGGAGAGDGKFSVANNISTTNLLAVSKENEVFVCDPGNSRVQVFDLNGAFLRKFGQLGNLPGQFPATHPQNIAIGGNGMLWFNDGKIFNKDGSYLKTVSIVIPHSGSADGMVAATHYVWNGTITSIFSPTMGGGAFHGVPAEAQSVGTYTGWGDCTFSQSGYFFIRVGSKCYRNNREYSSAINFTNPSPLPQAEILSASQRLGTNLVDIKYRVIDADSPSVTTTLMAFIEGRDRLSAAVPMKTFVEGTSGNVGANQPTNTIRDVVWNMPADWAVTYSNIMVEALAKDERNLMGVHWITVPASGGNPALQVSHKSIEEADLYDLWLWLIGNNDATFSSVGIPETSIGVFNRVKGNSGIYNNINLVDLYFTNHQGFLQLTTKTGRLFALSKMGARPISAAELARAQAGSYGFASLNANSIVKDSAIASSGIQGFGNAGDGRADFQTFSGNNPVSMDAGLAHNLILRNDGSLWGYGDNSFGQLGLGDTVDRSVPAKIADGVSHASAGGFHSCFVKTDGSLWTMGRNDFGQLGDGTTTQRNFPVQITTGVAKVSAGQYHTLFVRTNGALSAAGDNRYGQLGDGSNTQRNSPVQIAVSVASAEAGGASSFFVRNDGILWVTGHNQHGQLGTGNTTQRNTPAQIVVGVAAVTASPGEAGDPAHTLILKTDGSLWGTGSNSLGQLGGGNNTSRTSFAQITTGVAKVSAGRDFTAFSRTNGSLWTMGNNNHGQLGNGSTANSNTPNQIFANMTDFSCGLEHLVVLLPAEP